jgi:hypothetical protein
MSREEVDEHLAPGGLMAILSVSRPDKGPVAVPLAYLWEGGQFLLMTPPLQRSIWSTATGYASHSLRRLCEYENSRLGRAEMKKMPKPKGSWSKGGLRFTKLRSKVESLAPGAQWWFIGTKGSSTGLVGPTGASLLFSKEQVFAVTGDKVYVIPLSGPGIVSTKIKSDSVRSFPKSDVDVGFDADNATLTIGDVTTKIFPYHEYEALQFANACGAKMPDWFTGG